MRFAALLLFPLAASAADVQFNRDVRPILSDNCFACHGPDQNKVKGGLRLDVEKSAKAEAKSGAVAVVPGDAKKSELLVRVLADGKDHMPPAETGKSLTKEQVATLTKWIEQGAKWEDHWAFTPIRANPDRKVGGANLIDHFIAAKLKEKGLTPTGEADKVTLIRRITFDLTGLPPMPNEVDDFLKDATPAAYEKVVDRLLASPAYGERMAAFWLDIVRYADSVGYHGDQPVSVWPYRDWVVKSLNNNMKFDDFTRWQLGGDLMPNPTQEQKIAAGYNRLGMMSAEGGVQPKEYLAKYAAERVRAVGGGWLGLTTGCCECHDHKFDPLSLKDFYRLEAFFADIQERGLYDGGNFGTSMTIATPEQEKKLAELDAAAKQTQKAAAGLKGLAGVTATSPADKAARDAKAARDGFAAGLPATLITVAVPPRPIRVLNRGNWMDDTGEVVEPGVPAVLPQPANTGKRLNRLDLADWLVGKDNPLTARVLANRLWKLFFGSGLARKMDDLGSQGEPPTHPELLDALAFELRETWDLKRFVKGLVMSQTYRRSSMATAEQKEKDPLNLWLARQNRWRLDAEMVRDNALSVGGLLVNKLGGPPAKPYQPRGYWAFLNFPTREWQNDTGDGLYRRTLYTHWQRQYLHPTLLAFDAPTREECTADRVRSNTPLQSLVLLNAPEFVEAARLFAERVIAEGGKSPEERIDFAFRLALSRPAKPVEKETLAALLSKHREQYTADAKAAEDALKTGAKPANAKLDKAELAAWTSVTRAILNLHAVVTRN
ncbi:MAG: PSD1 and planctomycete cytochrome C domain-containing protein [Fimbriiglobus sp.]|jgi:mono/diheme cytochrome c family protein|nr:PSD1 and planctomycete cytochrome C domain-containing protein [Fimbriiglobus sp.]